MVSLTCSLRFLISNKQLKFISEKILGFRNMQGKLMLIPNMISNLGGHLSGKGRVSLLNVDCTLEGEFVNGKLHGPVRGLTTKGTKGQSF